jgi:hypothetical protein
MAAAGKYVTLPVKRSEWPKVKLEFEALASGNKFLSVLDDSYPFVQPPHSDSSDVARETFRKDQSNVADKRQTAWFHLFNLCKDHHMYILLDHKDKPFDTRIVDTWKAIIAEMEGKEDATSASDIFTEAIGTKMLETGDTRVEFKNFIAKIDHLAKLSEAHNCAFTDAFKLALIKQGLPPTLDLSQHMAAIHGSSDYKSFCKSISAAIDSTYSIHGKRKSAAQIKTEHQLNEKDAATTLMSNIQALLDNHDDEETESEDVEQRVMELLMAHKRSKFKHNTPGAKFRGICFECQQPGHRKGDPKCPHYKANSKKESSQHQDEDSSSTTSPSSQSSSSSSSSSLTPQYHIHIPANYSGSPLFANAAIAPPTVPALPTRPNFTQQQRISFGHGLIGMGGLPE